MSDRRELGGRPPSPREPDERLADWVDGCMSDRDRDRFTAELRVNPQLRADLAAYERTVATLRQALQAPTAPLPRKDTAGGGATLADRVLAQIQGQAPVRSLRHTGGGIAWRPVLWSLASAAALLLLTLLLDSWSVEPVGQRQTAAFELDASPAVASPAAASPAAASPAAADGVALPLEQVIDPGSPVGRDKSASAASPAPAKAEELAQELAKNEIADAGTGDATRVSEERLDREALKPTAPKSGAAGRAELAGSVQPGSLGVSEVRREAEPVARALVVGAPAAAAPVAPAPAPGDASPAKDESKKDEGKKDESKEKRGGHDDVGQAPRDPDAKRGQPELDLGAGVPAVGGASRAAKPTPTAPAGGGGAVVDNQHTVSDLFYLGRNEREAATPWSLLLVDGVAMAPAPVAAGGRGAAPPVGDARSRGPVAGPAGPATGGPTGPATGGPTGPATAAPAGQAAPAGVAVPALTPTELAARIDAFLAAAVKADAPPVLALPTANGTLRLMRVPLAELSADLALAALVDRAAGAAEPLEASWAVDGPQDDVAALLRRVELFARAPDRSLRSGETAAPALPTASATAEAPIGQRRLVLRFRLRPR